ncbi:PTS transporter subunit EIIB [Dickeya fangzhongdai]|uniref:PTS transporter subunit EIIB n=1 Tax=Dickeya fangzhongdai TaxID=1778540 RepID=UPI0033074D36
MSGIRDYAKLAQSILQEVGGQPNIVDFSRCATRLRLILAQTPDNAKARVQSLPGVIAVVESAGQFQVVIGVHVAEVYSQMAALLGEGAKRGEEPRRRVLDTVIATMSAVFAPIVYILAAAGILQGILIVIQQFSAGFTLTGTYRVLISCPGRRLPFCRCLSP